MKKITIFLIISLIGLFLSNCKKETEEAYRIPIYNKGVQDTGWGKALRDGEYWEATAFAQRDRDSSGWIGFHFNTFTDLSDLRELLAFTKVPAIVGTYEISGKIGDYNSLIGTNYGIMESDGDVVGVQYKIDTTTQGIMKITSVDNVLNIVEGTFDLVKFNKYWSYEGNVYPKQVEFKNCSFKIKIID